MKAEQFYALAGLIYLSPRTDDRLAVGVAFLFFVMAIVIGWRRTLERQRLDRWTALVVTRLPLQEELPP